VSSLALGVKRTALLETAAQNLSIKQEESEPISPSVSLIEEIKTMAIWLFMRMTIQ